MFPNTSINNIDIIFSLLYSIFKNLQKEQHIDFEKITKMRAYSLSTFTDSFKDQINKFYSNSTKFNSYIGNLNEFPLYKPFQNRNFETDIQLPILSNIQVHNNDNNNNENNNDDKDKDYNDNSINVKSTFNSNFTLDSFRDDILRQDTNKSEK